jgi:predicted ATPase
MIKEIEIVNYKCLGSEDLVFGKLNIVTGLNSVGKSSLIQAILHYSRVVESRNLGIPPDYSDFDDIRKKDGIREIRITINGNTIVITEDAVKEKPLEDFPVKNKGLYYLSAARIGPRDLHAYKKDSNSITGDEGEFIFSIFENKKGQLIADALVKRDDDLTLSGNVDFWLEKIFDSKIRLNSEVVTSNTLKIYYKFGDLGSVSPAHLGAGVSYVVQIIILCLIAKPGEIVIIENPEIHLHPAAQSKLGEFFAFVASKGIQVVIETHCEHLINRIRYEVCHKRIENEEVKIFYKSTSTEPFIKISLNSSGHYINEEKEKISFPTGFFDSTLQELLELG